MFDFCFTSKAYEHSNSYRLWILDWDSKKSQLQTTHGERRGSKIMCRNV